MAKKMILCIQKFLKHVETLEGDGQRGINREFRHIYTMQMKYLRDDAFRSDVGEENMDKNLYLDIRPYDCNRILLSEKDGDAGSNYINASFIHGAKGIGGYIATQGPLASTHNDFWRMIWEKEMEIVFMACRPAELGFRGKRYWKDVGKADSFGDVKVLTKSEERLSPDFIKREFSLTRGEQTRTVVHYNYLGWPDRGIPEDPAHIRDLIAVMRQTARTAGIPICVHCRGGIGRTGTIIAIDYVWTLLEEGKLDEDFSLCDLICKFRQQRMFMVETPDQYALVYRVLKSLCEEWLAKNT